MRHSEKLNGMQQWAIRECLEARKRAINVGKSTTKVGAAIYTYGEVVGGFNIQNRSQKSYHAEEVACINYFLRGLDPKDAKGMMISFSNNDIERLTFACAHCRQTIWETFQNPDFMVYEVDLDGNVIKKMTIAELYPMPWPR